MKTSTKYWIYALVINPITTLIIYYMFNAGFNLLNLIGVGIIGWHFPVLRCSGYSYRRSCPSGLQEKEGQGRQEEKEALSLKAVRNYR